MNTYTPQDINEIIFQQDVQDAVRVLSLAKKDPSFEIDSQTEIQLSYVRINSLSVNRLRDLLDRSVLGAYTIPDYILSEKIKDYIEQANYVPVEIEVYKHVIESLENHQEKLGKNDILLKNKTVSPTIANWIEDYLLGPSDKGSKNVLTEVQYIANSPNPKLLNTAEKEVLKDLIKIYDQSIQAVSDWEAVPDEISPGQAKLLFKDFDLYKTIPEIKDDLDPTQIVVDSVQPSTAENKQLEIDQKLDALKQRQKNK